MQRAPGVTIASDPPGARILVDGRDSGFVTPAEIDLGRSRSKVELVLEGYEPAARNLVPVTEWNTVFYDEMIAYPNTWRFPLWLNYEDAVAPYKRNQTYSPQSIFVRLRLAGE
jgi:hypothetical protein